MTKRHRNLLLVGLTLAFIATSISGIAASSSQGREGVTGVFNRGDGPAACGNRGYHSPIVIRGDAMFKLGPAVGVRNPAAAGTAEDPYVISGWCVTPVAGGANPRNAGIYIHNTTSHVVLRDNQIDGRPVTDATAHKVAGIVLNTAQNASS